MDSSAALKKTSRELYYESELLDTYRQRAANLKGRKFEYLKENYKNSSRDLVVITTTGVACGVIGGACTGAIIGGVCGCPGGPPGMLIGGAIGAGVGAGIGIALGGGTGIIWVSSSYKEWLDSELGQEFAENFRIFLDDLDDPDKICAITQDVPMDAVRTPQGQLYERKEILHWIAEHGTDPLTRSVLNENQLIEDNEASFHSLSQISKIIEEDWEFFKQKAEFLLPGLERLNREIHMQLNKLIEKEIQKVELKLENQDISASQFREEISVIRSKFSFDKKS
jgi:hypothetical protein